MQQNKDIHQKAEAVLNSLDGISTATPGPFFYTRLQARMSRSSRSVWDQLVYMLNRPAVAIGVAALVIAINTTVVLREQQSPSYTEQSELTVSEEYNIASNTYLEEINQEP